MKQVNTCLICSHECGEGALPVYGEFKMKGEVHSQCLEGNIRSLIADARYEALLRKIVNLEVEYAEKGRYFSDQEQIAWEWSDVNAPPAILRKFVYECILTILFCSNRRTMYSLVDRDLTKEVLGSLDYEGKKKIAETRTIPQDLFESIVGYEDEKELIKMSLGKPQVAFGVFGPPASGKSLFLTELERIGGRYIDASRLSAPGLARILATNPPFVLIDEIDKLKDAFVFGILNTLIEEGLLIESKVGMTRTLNLNTQVFVAGLNAKNIPADFHDRIISLHFKRYTEDEFREVVTKLLTRRYGADENCALYIAEQVAKRLDMSVRTARNVYLLCAENPLCANIDRTIRILHKNLHQKYEK